MRHQEARAYILVTLLFASIILAACVHGPRILAYMSQKTGYHAVKEESDYAFIPATVGRAALHVLVADTEDRRIRGLSHRQRLGENVGMLFVFDEPGIHGIWMKEMKFPIDIMWFDSNLKVVFIQENVSPETFPHVYEPTQSASFVLETNAGFVEKHNITLGSELVLYR